MNQLQKVADAYKELEYRRHGSNKKEQSTGGNVLEEMKKLYKCSDIGSQSLLL